MGTYWRFGELARISWRHNLGPDARFIVVLSADGGETFSAIPLAIATYTPTTATLEFPFEFTYRFKPTTRALVRVYDQDGAAHDDSYQFSIGKRPRPVKYRVTDLGAADDVSSEAAGLSANGYVAGSARRGDGALTAFLFRESRLELGTLGGCCSAAADVGSWGQTVGWARTGTGVTRAFLAQHGLGMRDLGTLGGNTSRSDGHQRRGHGRRLERGGRLHAPACLPVDAGLDARPGHAWRTWKLWRRRQQLRRRGRALRCDGERARAGVRLPRRRDARHQPGVLERERSHRHQRRRRYRRLARAIRGETTGQSAFVRAADGRIRDLGALGGSRSVATAINGRGDVVGNVDGVLAFLYEKGSGGMRDLNVFIAPDSDWVLRSATGINDRGQIAGTGEYRGTLRAFLLTPIVHLASLSVTSRTLDACSVGTLTIKLDGPAPEDIRVELSDFRPVFETAPVAVIREGESSVDVDVSSNGWASAREGRITASYGGRTFGLDLRVRPIAPRAVTMAATAVAGEVVAGTVVLPCVAVEPIEVTVRESRRRRWPRWRRRA